MPFMGVGPSARRVIVDGRDAECLWTFWFEGSSADGSIMILVGSADNLLSVDADSFRDLDQLRPGFNFPSGTEGLTALIQAVTPRLQTNVPDDDWDYTLLGETDIAHFALAVTRIADESEYPNDEDDGVWVGNWVRRSGVVHGLARVYASALGRDLNESGSRFDWLPDDAQVVVGAPYALYIDQ